MSNEIRNLFLGDVTHVDRPNYVCDIESYKLLRNVFPEHGVIGYLPGLFMQSLAKALKNNGIKTFSDRNGSAIATLQELVLLIQSSAFQIDETIAGRASGSSNKRQTTGKSKSKKQNRSHSQSDRSQSEP